MQNRAIIEAYETIKKKQKQQHLVYYPQKEEFQTVDIQGFDIGCIGDFGVCHDGCGVGIQKNHGQPWH